ncbi:NACHT, LRR and PYD domains-containing protein 14 isoform X1 [Erinaceus europaeus]|uniref:NACHT, LRR and PYD domains-containing protein 14 isoform X1 n=1 Tax=Erinaceus europaeus TaxID=9365 RepID=A0A1S3WH93_ERIEU|nr:NACHT, LRR and PYD domains-containing protein 14 isoform X1 [Erinaceus europaeus]
MAAPSLNPEHLLIGKMTNMFSSPLSIFELLLYLEKLNIEELNRFKLLLKDEMMGTGDYQIPWTQVKTKASVLAKLMDEYYSVEQVWNVTLKIFDQMNLKFLCGRLKAQRTWADQIIPQDARTEPAQDTQSSVLGEGEEYRIRIKEKFGILYSKLLPGESDFCDGILREDEKLLETMFEVVTTGKEPERVVLHGAAGIGKTTLMIKAMLAWAEGRLFQKFDYVFYLNAKEINHLKENSFLQMISKYWPSTEGPIEKIMMKPSRLLFIIDGIDEMNFAFEEPVDALCKEWNQLHPASFLMSSLLRNRMLPESSLLLTARLTDSKKLKLLNKARFIEMHGMTEDAIKEFIFQLFEDKNWALEMFNSLQDNETLFSMCKAPQVCWDICNSLKQQVEKGGNVTLACQTITEVLTCCISDLFQPTKDCPRVPSEIQLKRLCYLAAKGIWNMTYVFYRETLRKHGLLNSDISVFLGMNIIQQDVEYESCYVFTHIHVQEYLAALSYMLEGDWGMKSDSFQSFEHLKLLLESKMYNSPHLINMKCFLFGLLNENRIRRLERCLNCTMLLDVKDKILQWVKRLGSRKYFPSRPEFLDLLHYLYETQDEAWVKQAMKSFQKVEIDICERRHMTVSSYCLKNCQCLQHIKLCKKVVSQMLKSSLKTETWQRQADEISKGWQDLCSVLHTNKDLRELELWHSDLDALTLKTLVAELRHPDCKLRKLVLKYVSFPDGCQDIFSSLTQSCNLNHLYVKGYNMKDQDVKSLCEGLKHPKCKLQDLGLESCSLTTDSCVNISEALIRYQNLINLSLSTNSLSDKGVKLLCEALRHPKCQLKRLSLMDCNLTRACCLELASAISNSPNLYRLNLGENNLEDDGVKILNEALRNPTCNIQRLGLEYCGLTSHCCQDLASTLRTSPKLIEINLIKNKLDLEGIKKLCDVLKSPQCKLQVLGLCKDDFDEVVKKMLEEVELSNSQLTIKSNYKEDRSWCWFL